jgi:hypothetical protein
LALWGRGLDALIGIKDEILKAILAYSETQAKTDEYRKLQDEIGKTRRVH